jgi:hypothetical protein
MSLLLHFALFGLAACAAFAAEAAGFSFWTAALAAAVAFFTVDVVAFGGIRLRGAIAGVGLTALVFMPATLAGYSVGALAAEWVGLDPAGSGLGATFATCLIVWRRGTAQPN